MEIVDFSGIDNQQTCYRVSRPRRQLSVLLLAEEPRVLLFCTVLASAPLNRTSLAPRVRFCDKYCVPCYMQRLTQT